MADAIEDNESPFAAYVPHVPEEKRASAESDNAKLSSSVGVLQDFFTDLEEDIELSRGLDLISGVNPSTNPNDLLIAVIVNNQVRDKLKQIRDKYRVKYSQYVQESDV